MSCVRARFIAVTPLLVAVGTACAGGLERRAADIPGPVSSVVPLAERTAVARVRAVLEGKARAAEHKYARFILATVQDPIFPEDHQVRSAAQQDPTLQRYLSIPRDARKSDLYYFEPSGDQYWLSEYHYKGAPAKFRCGFILHFEAVSSAQTRIEVLEYLPTVLVGEKLGFGAHGPGRFLDIRSVQPTTIDRVELLRSLTDALASD